MRAFVISFLCGLVGFGAVAPSAQSAGTSPKAAAEPQVLRVYNWEEYMSPDVVRRFEAKHGVRVELETYGSTEELVTNVETRPGRYDVIFPSSYTVAYLRSKGLLAPLDKRNIPNIANLDSRFRSPNYDPGSRYCVAYLWSKLVLGYNATKVARKPRSWTEMFEPQYAGRIALLTDSRESLGVVLLMMGYSPNTTDPTEIAKARDFLLARNRQVHAYADDSVERLLEDGTVDFALGWEGDMASLSERRPDLRYVVPAEGSVFATDSLCIPKSSRNKLLAERFIDFVLDAENGAQLSRELLYPTPNLAAQPLLPPEARARQIPSDDTSHRLFPLVDVGTTVLSLYDAAWERILEDHRSVRRPRK
jgi:spermidine/putrescine-binding protein